MTPTAKEDHWKAQYEAAARRAFELHVLELIRGYGPIQDAIYKDAHGNSQSVIFLSAELVGEYPRVRVRIRMYDRARDLEMVHEYPIWGADSAGGEIGNVQKMQPPERIAGDMLIWARGG